MFSFFPDFYQACGVLKGGCLYGDIRGTRACGLDGCGMITENGDMWGFFTDFVSKYVSVV